MYMFGVRAVRQPQASLAAYLLLCLTLPASAQTASWEAGIAKIIPHNGKSPGTAFVVTLQNQTAWLVTSAHVVQGDPAPEVEFRANPNITPNPKATVRSAQFDNSYGERGLAILVVANPPAGVRALPSAGVDVAVLDSVVVAGYPDSNLGAFRAASIDVGSADGTEIVVNFPTDAGFSGGPVLRNEMVVGMIFGERPNAGVAVPAGLIHAYLKGKVVWAQGEQQTPPKNPVLAPATPTPSAPRAATTKVNDADKLTYVWIPSGKFTMGCSPGDKSRAEECFTWEETPHLVEIKQGFWMGQTEVTQAAYERIRKKPNPSKFKGDERPVEQVTWNEALAYCKAVGLRLPTEAEWEYAARAGDPGARYGDINDIGWYQGNSSQTHPVKQKTGNAWGLYDMLGNVWEWVNDVWAVEPGHNIPVFMKCDDCRVIRGGPFDASAAAVRSSYRVGKNPSRSDSNTGFRCAGDLL
jgi:formylglycine-generating enzyme required for sulfatase activity